MQRSSHRRHTGGYALHESSEDVPPAPGNVRYARVLRALQSDAVDHEVFPGLALSKAFYDVNQRSPWAARVVAFFSWILFVAPGTIISLVKPYGGSVSDFAQNDALGIEVRLTLPADQLYSRFFDEINMHYLADSLCLTVSLPGLFAQYAGMLPPDIDPYDELDGDADSLATQYRLNTVFIILAWLVAGAQLNSICHWAMIASAASLQRDENFARWYADRGHCAYLAASNAHTNAWTSLSLLVAYLPIVLYWTTDRVRALVPAALLVWVSTQIMWLLVSPHNPFPSVCAAANLPDNKLAQQRFQADAAAFREQLGQPPQPPREVSSPASVDA